MIQTNEVRKSIHDLDMKVSNMDEKFSKGKKILKKKNNGNEKHNKSNKNIVEVIIDRIDQAEAEKNNKN
jgi:hypothetical protein